MGEHGCEPSPAGRTPRRRAPRDHRAGSRRAAPAARSRPDRGGGPADTRPAPPATRGPAEPPPPSSSPPPPPAGRMLAASAAPVRARPRPRRPPPGRTGGAGGPGRGRAQPPKRGAKSPRHDGRGTRRPAGRGPRAPRRPGSEDSRRQASVRARAVGRVPSRSAPRRMPGLRGPRGVPRGPAGPRRPCPRSPIPGPGHQGLGVSQAPGLTDRPRVVCSPGLGVHAPGDRPPGAAVLAAHLPMAGGVGPPEAADVGRQPLVVPGLPGQGLHRQPGLGQTGAIGRRQGPSGHDAVPC